MLRSQAALGIAIAVFLFQVRGAALAAPPAGPILLLPPGQVVPLPAPGAKSEMPLPAYDNDDDTRNEWSKKEFPHYGECRWMPTEWGGKPTGDAATTAAERQAIQQALEKVIAFLKTAPVASPPVGICPWVVSAGPDGAVDQGHALESSFMVANWGSKTLSRSKPGDRVIRGELHHLIFSFNKMPGAEVSPAFSSPFEMADAQGEFFPEGQPNGLFQGFPVYFKLTDRNVGDLVIPLHNRPLFRPVRVGRMVRWQLAQFDKELGQIRAMMDSARREYDAFFTPTAKADEERIIARRVENERARTPEQQARVRASREAEVEQRTKELRAKWDVAATPGHPFNAATRRKAEAEGRLARLSPAEAEQAACLITLPQSFATPDIGTAGGPACAFALVERDPDYYDRSLPRTAIQLVVISRFEWLAPVGGLPGDRYRDRWANRNMLWGLDWQRFRRDVLGAKTAFDVAAVAPYRGVPQALPPEAANAAPRVTVAAPDSPPVAPPSAGALAAAPETFRPRGELSTERPTLQTLLPVYRTDQLVEVRFTGMSGLQRDWMAIVPAGAPIEQYGEWTYFHGKASGTHKFSRLLKPGRYEVRAFDEGPVKLNGVKARTEFEVR
jgi:hypothetical protein